MGPNNNIDRGGPDPLNLIFANQFKWAPNSNIDSEGPGPLNLIFANQFKRVIQVKIRVFILKVANSGPHVSFVWTSCNIQGRIKHMAQCQGPRAHIRLFLVFTCIWQKNIAKIPKCQMPYSM